MDSTAYAYLIGDIRKTPNASFAMLPVRFAKGPVDCSKESIESLLQFLRDIADCKDLPSACPRILKMPENEFGELFLRAHAAVLDVLEGAEPDSHEFRSSGIQLTRLLCMCAREWVASLVLGNDCGAAAMFCFLLEAMMHAGWCPNAFEGIAKRSAHSWFLTLRKSMHRCDPASTGAVEGYLCGAWLLSQKTEGIYDTSAVDDHSAVETLQWAAGAGSYSYIARYISSPPLFHLLNTSDKRIAHPFVCFTSASSAGMKLFANGDPIVPCGTPSVKNIERPKASGTKLTYPAVCAQGFRFKWTVVTLVFESTTYRIDIVNLIDTAAYPKLRAELQLETDAPLKRLASGSFFGKGPRNTVVRFVQDPFDFRYVAQEQNGICFFESTAGIALASGATLRSACAWAAGKGITSMHETKLLGIYDEEL